MADIITEALERFDLVSSKERDERDKALEDMRFANASDGQWDSDAKTKRAARPRYTINRVAPGIDQLVGDQRQNRTSIKVRPVSGGADEDIADIYNGLIRNIESQSKAQNSYDGAYDEQVTGGYGGWRVLTDFNDDDSFEQDIRIKPILSSASSLWLDPSTDEYDKRDAMWGFVTTAMTLDEFEDKYPDAPPIDFSVEIKNNPKCGQWFNNKMVMVAEYWRKIKVDRTILLLSDGRVIDKEDEEKVLDELKDSGINVVKERKTKSHKVEMYTINGSQVLDGPNAWAGKFIPLVEVRGKITQIENETLVRGLVRFAKDPQRIYNYSSSANIEAIALTPKDPYWITPKQALGHEEKLRTFAQKNDPFMLYNEDESAPGPPKRTGAPSVQTALMTAVQQAALDVEATMGIHAASLGNAPQLLSERSVQSQAEKGDRGAYVFQDNLNKSKKFTADILLDLIPKIYDNPRMIRVLNLDGTSDEVRINTEALDDINQPIVDEETGEQVIVNDLSQGKYETEVDTGPAFATQRQETVNQLIELTGQSELFQELAMDLVVKNLDILDNDELTKRVRKRMISQGIVEPTEDEIKEFGLDQPQKPDPNEEALRDNVEMQTTDLMSQIEKRDADRDKVEAQVLRETISGLKDLVETYKMKLELGIPITPEELALKDSQEGIVELTQDQTATG